LKTNLGDGMQRANIGKNISANIFSNIWLTLLLLFLTPLYILFLGVESYGLIGFYLSWIAILGILDAGISATAVREISWLTARHEEKGKIPTLLRSLEVVYWGIILILGVGLLIGAWLIGQEWFQTKDLSPELVRNVMMLMVVSLVAQVPSGLYIGGLMALQRQVECSALLAFFGTVRGLGSVLVLWLIRPDIQTFFLWQIVVSILHTMVMRWSLWRRVSIDGYPAKFSLEMLKSTKGFMGAAVLIAVLGIIMAQADKMILTRFITLEAFGFYMLAWTVASGFSRVATPLIQAFSPRFTELVSKGDEEALAKQFCIASQAMSVLIIPPAALIFFLSEPVMFAWLSSQVAAEGSAQILAVLMLGIVLSSCSFPAVSILYSRKQLRPVVGVHLACLVVIMPLLVVAVFYFGVLGAAYIWGFYGLVQYVAFQVYGLRGLPNTEVFSSIVNNFAIPCLVSFAVAGMAGYWLAGVSGKITFVLLFAIVLLAGWLATLLACRDLFTTLLENLKWKVKTSL